MPADRPRTPDHRKTIAVVSFAAFVLIVVAGKITPSATPHAKADPIVNSNRISYTPVLATHFTGPLTWRARAPRAEFVRFEPGNPMPWHSHSRSYVGLLVTGMMRNPFSTGAEASTIEPGTFWYVPSETQHMVVCVSEKPCLAYVRFGR